MQNFSLPTLQTDRLLLRQMVSSDAGAIAQLRSDDVVNRYIERSPTCSVEEAIAFVEKINGVIARGESFYWAISFKHDPRLLGTCCVFHFSPDRRTAELGYELQPVFHGRGLVSQAVAAVIAHVFANTGLEKLKAVVHKQNGASIGVLRKQGFILKQESDTDFPDFGVYELERSKKA